MSEHDELLARLEYLGKHNDLLWEQQSWCIQAAAAIRYLQEQLAAERRAREEAERKCAQLVMDGMDEEVKLKQRAESAERRLAEVEQDARRYRFLRDSKNYPSDDWWSFNVENLECEELDAAIDAAIKESAAAQGNSLPEASFPTTDTESTSRLNGDVDDPRAAGPKLVEGTGDVSGIATPASVVAPSKLEAEFAAIHADIKAAAAPIAPAQSSTATVQCISGGDTLTEREVPIVGQGETAQGAAPLEPVAWTSGPIANLWAVWLASGGGYIFSFASRDYPQQAQFQAEGLADALNKLRLYAIPHGYAVVPAEILDRFPEINPNNYDHEDVCRLNDWGIEVVLAAGRVK